ncbi:YciI family protein [Gramella sp. AN32]|uniref:YciI family protein n=1 Tax=Christiangramia antarctica TaxID=2058158 RepID=A0ABW5X393_9FLAO|nr:YciI family protein [Gramella sp. AN32]MCM4154910.1 hypothetical protein [Gramella sp. AN32]
MKKLLILIIFVGLMTSCLEVPPPRKYPKKENELVTAAKEVERKDSLKKLKEPKIDIAAVEKKLKDEGYNTFSYKEGDTTYLMQEYYMVFLKEGPNRRQDSLEAASIQEKHMAHLQKLYEDGYTSLTGPMGDNGEIKGIVVFNTSTQKEADSLANMDPAVKAGRLVVEVHPWWAAKGGKLN